MKYAAHFDVKCIQYVINNCEKLKFAAWNTFAVVVNKFIAGKKRTEK